jgi:hypothetical protein
MFIPGITNLAEKCGQSHGPTRDKDLVWEKVENPLPRWTRRSVFMAVTPIDVGATEP